MAAVFLFSSFSEAPDITLEKHSIRFCEDLSYPLEIRVTVSNQGGAMKYVGSTPDSLFLGAKLTASDGTVYTSYYPEAVTVSAVNSLFETGETADCYFAFPAPPESGIYTLKFQYYQETLSTKVTVMLR